jgi:hypothetical protein
VVLLVVEVVVVVVEVVVVVAWGEVEVV